MAASISIIGRLSPSSNLCVCVGGDGAGPSCYPFKTAQGGGLPSTLEQALQPSNESRIITEPNEPFRIVHVNEVWCRVCGYDAEETLGQTCKILQGLGTCKATLTMLRQALLLKRNFAVQLLNYTKRGRPFMNTLQVTPLVNSEGAVTHYLGVVIARFLDGGGPVPAVVQHSAQSAPLPMVTNQTRQDLSVEDVDMDMENGEDVSDDSGSGGANAGRVPPFLTKLSEILSSEPPEIITFNPDEASFIIHDASKFAKEVLPQYFKHNKLGSFSQQLHTYGFRRKANSSSLDASVEFYHDQYCGEATNFLSWIRMGGALSKRTAHVRDPHAEAPPAQLIHDMLALAEGTRSLAATFNQAKATHTMQLRSILMKLMLRGMLAPESVSYISAMPPATPMLPVPAASTRPTGFAALDLPSASSLQYSLASNCMNSVDGLQAQLDALEAGILPLAGSIQPHESGDLQGDEALQLFADSSAPAPNRGMPDLRQPPYPVHQPASLLRPPTVDAASKHISISS